jgi:CzcA family heavy metal efflux pump
VTPVRFIRANRYAVFLLTVFLVAAGLWAMLTLPSNIYPELNFPRVVILAHSGDLAPDAMLIEVTRPLEESVSTVLGVRRVRSRTIRGGTEISVLFRPDMDMQLALQLVQGQVGEVRGELPTDTEIEVARISPAVFPVLSLILSGNVPGADLHDYARYVLKPLFSRVSGVGQIEVQASDTREVSVVVDPGKLLAHHLSAVDVAERLKATNQVVSVGRLQKDYLQYLVLATGQLTTLDDLRNTVVATEGATTVRLGDLAEVSDGAADRTVLITGNGRPAALLNVTRQIGANILELARGVKEQAAHLGAAIPPTLHLQVVYDLAEFVAAGIANVRDAIVIGALLAVLILFVFLREGRTTLIAAVSLPLSVVGTFFVLKLAGGTLNLMTLGGLAIAIGLIIDDAVVVIEAIYRHIGLGRSPAEAAEVGTGELLGPVIGSTATTLVVFLPLGLLEGVVGEFFRALCLTLGASVLLSMLFAVTLIPLLAERFLPRTAHHEAAERFMAPVNRVYERAVRWALGRRLWVAGATAVAVLLGVALYLTLETGFLPEMDEGGFVLDYVTAPGTSLAETDRLLQVIEGKIAKLPEVDGFSRRTGAEMGMFATEQNTGDILVKMKPAARRSRGTEDVIADLRGQIEADVPGIEVEFVQILQDMIGDLEGSPEPVEVKLFGDDLPTLERVIGEVAPRVEKIPGIVDLMTIKKGNPEVVMHVDPALAGRVGLTVEEVSKQVSAGLLGITETALRRGDRTIDVRVRFPDAFRGSYESVRTFPIVTAAKQIVPLESLASVEHVRGASRLERENGRLMVALTARLEGRDLGSAIRDVRAVLADVRLPVGCVWEIGGQYESQQSSFRELLVVLALALAAVFAVLVIQFRAFRPALVILSAAPLSLLGVFAMLKVTGTPLNVSSFMGIILMIGLVVKNGIILFDVVHVLREEQGMALDEALVAAGRIRVRPILMTTLATLFGLLPLALGLGAGAELQKPLALAVIGGLVLSTFITLLVMPVLFALLERSPRGAALPREAS